MKFWFVLLAVISFSKAHADFPDLGAMFNNMVHPNSGDDGEVTQNDDESDVDSDEVRIVIDRNPAVQQMKVYVDGQVKTFNISTGRESFDFPTNYKQDPECSITPLSDPTKPFHIQRMYELDRSTTWLHKNETDGSMQGSDMPHAMFIVGGIAMHATSGDGITALGPKSDEVAHVKGGSGGCIRMTPCDAEGLFDLFAKTRPMTADEKNQPASSADLTCPADKLPDGQTYDRVNMSLDPACRTSTNERCTDATQWPVKSNGRGASVSIVDTRPKADLDAMKKRCTDDKAEFNARKSQCLIGKLSDTITAGGGTVDSARLQSDATFRGQFLKDGLHGMTAQQRSDANLDCNKQLYFEHYTTKCHLAGIEKLPGHTRTLDPNIGMFDMTAVQALYAQQKPADMAKLDQDCAQQAADLMYVSPSDPSARPETAPPVPMPSRPRGL